MVSHHYMMEDSVEAFKTAETGCGNPIKVMIHAGEDV